MAGRSWSRRARGAAGVALGTSFLLLTAACGPPQHTYLANGELGAYLRIPNEWHVFDAEEVRSYLEDNLETPDVEGTLARLWTVAFDASDDPDIARVGVTQVIEEPFGRLQVHTLRARERELFSLRGQRNLAFPLDEFEQAQPPRAAVLNEGELINADSYHGVGLFYDVVVDGGVLRMAQTTWVDPTTEHVHLLLVGCSVDCFNANVEEIGDVMESYRVRSAA